MPDNTITLYDSDGNPVEVEKPEPANIRQMREHIATLEAEAKKAADLEVELTTLRRATALKDAGLAFDEDRMVALQAVHKGDWTPEAVKETAIKLGWAQADAGATDEERQALERMNAARSGGTTVPPDQEAAFQAKLAGAKNAAELMAIYRESGRPLV